MAIAAIMRAVSSARSRTVELGRSASVEVWLNESALAEVITELRSKPQYGSVVERPPKDKPSLRAFLGAAEVHHLEGHMTPTPPQYRLMLSVPITAD